MSRHVAGGEIKIRFNVSDINDYEGMSEDEIKQEIKSKLNALVRSMSLPSNIKGFTFNPIRVETQMNNFVTLKNE